MRLHLHHADDSRHPLPHPTRPQTTPETPPFQRLTYLISSCRHTLCRLKTSCAVWQRACVWAQPAPTPPNLAGPRTQLGRRALLWRGEPSVLTSAIFKRKSKSTSWPTRIILRAVARFGRFERGGRAEWGRSDREPQRQHRPWLLYASRSGVLSSLKFQFGAELRWWALL